LYTKTGQQFTSKFFGGEEKAMCFFFTAIPEEVSSQGAPQYLNFLYCFFLILGPYRPLSVLGSAGGLPTQRNSIQLSGLSH
jgi:hypothetical protein